MTAQRRSLVWVQQWQGSKAQWARLYLINTGPFGLSHRKTQSLLNHLLYYKWIFHEVQQLPPQPVLNMCAVFLWEPKIPLPVAEGKDIEKPVLILPYSWKEARTFCTFPLRGAHWEGKNSFSLGVDIVSTQEWRWLPFLNFWMPLRVRCVYLWAVRSFFLLHHRAKYASGFAISKSKHNITVISHPPEAG